MPWASDVWCRVQKMAFLFSKPLTPAEQLRKHKREIDRAIRDLERERNKLQMNEKKIIAEIRKAAQNGQQVNTGQDTRVKPEREARGGGEGGDLWPAITGCIGKIADLCYCRRARRKSWRRTSYGRGGISRSFTR